MKKIYVLVIILSIFFLWNNFSLYPNFEENVINQLNYDLNNSGLKSEYGLRDFLTQGGLLSFDGVIFRSPNNGLFEKSFGVRNDNVVKVFYLKLTEEGDLVENQLFLDNSLKGFDYICDENSQISVLKVAKDHSYYILPINCKIVKSEAID